MISQNNNSIAIFSNTFWSIYNFRRSLIKEFVLRGYKVIAISADDNYRSAVEELGCQTIVLKNLNAKSTSLITELKLIFEIHKVFANLSCKYIFTFTIKPNVYTALASFFVQYKTIVTVNGLGNVFSGNGIVKTISFQLFRLAFWRAHKIVFQNKNDFSFFQMNIGLMEKKVLFVRGSGVNVNEFLFSQRPSQPGSKLVFLLACRLLKEKGIYEYIEAARKIKRSFPDVQFWLIGMKAINHSAIELDSLRHFERDGVIQIKPATDDINGLLDTIDVLVLPSYYNEGVPRILLEGLAKGLPIITTDSVGCRETVIHNLNGYLVEPKNIAALEDSFRNMIEIPMDMRHKMRQESRKLAENTFNEEDVVETYINILNQAHVQVAL